MTPPNSSRVIQLSPDRVAQIRQSLQQLSNFLPEIDRMKDCDADCQEIADTAAYLQTILTRYLHHFGGGN